MWEAHSSQVYGAVALLPFDKVRQEKKGKSKIEGAVCVCHSTSFLSPETARYLACLHACMRARRRKENLDRGRKVNIRDDPRMMSAINSVFKGHSPSTMSRHHTLSVLYYGLLLKCPPTAYVIYEWSLDICLQPRRHATRRIKAARSFVRPLSVRTNERMLGCVDDT